MMTTMNHLSLSFGLCLLLATSLLAYNDNEPARNCYEPAKTGPCRAYFVRYFYNTGTHRCEKFVYGGCRENGNNYRNLGACQVRCLRFAQRPRSVCMQSAESGFCMAYFPRYFYNRKSRRCEKFIYGGCGGNRNRFTTKASCNRACKRY